MFNKQIDLSDIYDSCYSRYDDCTVTKRIFKGVLDYKRSRQIHDSIPGTINKFAA